MLTRRVWLILVSTVVIVGGLIFAVVQSDPDRAASSGGGQVMPATPSTPTTPSVADSLNTDPTVVAGAPPPAFTAGIEPLPVVEVGAGQPQPIDTQFGLRYTVPADWYNNSVGATQWFEEDLTPISYSAPAAYMFNFCPQHAVLYRAQTGMAGRNGSDVATAARDSVRQAESLYSVSRNPDVAITYSEPLNFEIGGQPAVRINADVTGLTVRNDCEPPEANFDIVATTGYSNATVAVFMIMKDQGVEDALSDSTADQIIASIQKSPQE